MTSEAKEASPRWQFVRARKSTILAISIVVIVPCLWHRRIEAGDLASHVYNAWLAQLIEKGQAPGLYIVRQWNNVLFDWLLLHAANLMGFVAAEKIVVSACSLIFFWGVFSLVAAASGRPPWFSRSMRRHAGVWLRLQHGFPQLLFVTGTRIVQHRSAVAGKGIGAVPWGAHSAVHFVGTPYRIPLAGRDGALSSSLDQAAEFVEVMRARICPRASTPLLFIGI